MNQYAERLRELEDALDKVTSDWLVDYGVVGGLPQCRYCREHMHYYWNPPEEPFKHSTDCPRHILVNDRIGYVRR